MSITTTRTGDIGQNFQQTTAGETPNSVEVSLNAKGQAQVVVKMYFSDPLEMQTYAGVYAHHILFNVKEQLAKLGIALAGQEGK